MQHITITGNTYPHRKTFAAMGGRWNATLKQWSIPAEYADEAQKLANEPRQERRSYEVRTSTGTYYRNYNGRCEDAPCCGCCTI